MASLLLGVLVVCVLLCWPALLSCLPGRGQAAAGSGWLMGRAALPKALRTGFLAAVRAGCLRAAVLASAAQIEPGAAVVRQQLAVAG